MVSQAVTYSLHLLPLFAFWYLSITELIPTYKYLPDCDCVRGAVKYAPFIAIVLFGAYAAASVLYGVLTFNDCAGARAELVEEISEARKDLKKKKII